jgi:hypothetical protein
MVLQNETYQGVLSRECGLHPMHPSITPVPPHLKYVLNDLLLIMEACLQLLHIELEQVQRGGACREGGRGAWRAAASQGLGWGRGQDQGVGMQRGWWGRKPDRRRGPGCLTRLAQHVGKADISADCWV